MLKQGRCQCGAVTFKTEAEPLRMAMCHCDACRRTTGTGHAVQAFFKKADVIISGQTKSHDTVSDRGNTRARHFCPVCGSRLFAENSAAPQNIGIAVGAFEESSWFTPDMVVYTKDKPVWDTTDPAVEHRPEG